MRDERNKAIQSDYLKAAEAAPAEFAILQKMLLYAF